MQPEASGARARHARFFAGWPGIVFVAATYVYFLIFAQFGFLQRVAERGISEAALPLIMGAMAGGGIAVSLLAPRVRRWNSPQFRLQAGFIGCGCAALSSLFPLDTVTAAGVALVIGLSLGLLTVTLVAHLRLWIGTRGALLKIALGTGIGYFACNIPALFNARPGTIAFVSALACAAALVVTARAPLADLPPSSPEPEPREIPFALALGWFTALVWLDSAAFFIIQNSSSLKAGAWLGNIHLWRTAILHLAAALLSAFLLARRGLALTLALALACLGGACVLLLNPLHASAAAILYPVGVSLYSVALVAYPSFLMPSAARELRGRRAGYLYAVAGWVGSALGIGMGRDLHHVPPAFVAVAAALFLLPWLWHAIESGRLGGSAQIQALAVLAVLALAFAVTLVVRPTIKPFANVPAPDTAVDRGRRVYISEGCISCHSQYVRPASPDVAIWGPASTMDSVRREHPPLIGNRRQGPDLAEVGARRSPLWLRIHFMHPRDVSYASPMPSYDYLFRNGRGDDLVAYLASLNEGRHWNIAASWQPAPAPWQHAPRNGATLFYEHCATCHSADGVARRKWSSSFHRLPPDLVRDPLQHVPSASPSEFRLALARITKFGIPDTDMPGHEYLPDEQIAAIAMYVAEQRHGSQSQAAR